MSVVMMMMMMMNDDLAAAIGPTTKTCFFELRILKLLWVWGCESEFGWIQEIE
jgi:hypothetical protein